MNLDVNRGLKPFEALGNVSQSPVGDNLASDLLVRQHANQNNAAMAVEEGAERLAARVSWPVLFLNSTESDSPRRTRASISTIVIGLWLCRPSTGYSAGEGVAVLKSSSFHIVAAPIQIQTSRTLQPTTSMTSSLLGSMTLTSVSLHTKVVLRRFDSGVRNFT